MIKFYHVHVPGISSLSVCLCRFKLFGKLRVLMSHVSTALRVMIILSALPTHWCLIIIYVDLFFFFCWSGQHWPEEGRCGHTLCLAPVPGDGVAKAEGMRVRPALVQSNYGTAGIGDWQSTVRGVELPGWKKKEHETLAGFKITPSTLHHDSISLVLWPRACLSKSAFIKHGYV